MSRIGKAPIPVPDGVQVNIEGRTVTVTGPRCTLSHEVTGDVSVRAQDTTLVVERSDDARQNRALHGLTRALVANMVQGVSQGFRKELEIVGVGYRATPSGDSALELALGYSHPVRVEAPEGITFEVPAATRVAVVGVDKQLVGQVAADIRSLRKPEPYKGKGIRYAGERIIRKAGKAGK
jgi:large subunit ribosomal protein L6